MTSLQTLVYVSSASTHLTTAQLEQLFLMARPKNTQAGVTGVLLYHDGNFMQCLEGPPEAVHATFRRIKGDPRHTGVTVIIDEPIEERSIGEWHMGYGPGTRSAMLAESTKKWETLIADNQGVLRASRGLTALVGFWKRVHRWS